MTETMPRVLVAISGVFPSTVINVAKPLLRLHEAGAIDLDLTLHCTVRRKQIACADVLVMSHMIDPAHVWILDCAREAGTPLLYDIDENLLEPPPDVPGLDFHRAPERQAAVRRCLQQAVLVRTYAPALKRYLEPFNATIARVDGPIDWRLIPKHLNARTSNRVHIVYATSRLQDSIGGALVVPLRRVLEEHADVDVTIWGPRLPGLDGYPRVRFREFVRDYDRYFEQFARVGFDIGLAPMPDDLWHECKTATKFREYAACRITGIYSDTEVYRDCVTDGVTGLLVPPNEEAWVAAMGRLIGDAALRRQIQERAEAYARERYAPGRMERDWLTHICRASLSRSASLAGERPSARGPSFSGERERPTSRASTSPFAVAVGIARQVLRYASRVPSLLRSGGVKEVWVRTRAQVAGLRQLMEWEFALWRIQRQQSRETLRGVRLQTSRSVRLQADQDPRGVRLLADQDPRSVRLQADRDRLP